MSTDGARSPLDVINDAIHFWKNKEEEAFGTDRHQECRNLRLVLEQLRREIKACNSTDLRLASEKYFDDDVPFAKWVLACKRQYIEVAMSAYETISTAEMALGIAPKTLWTLRMKLGMLAPEYHKQRGYYYDSHKA